MAKSLFNKNIIEILGIGSMPDGEKIALVERMAELVERRVILRLAESMTQDDLAELEKLSEFSAEEAAAFLKEKNPHLEKIVVEEIETVKQDAARVAKEIDKK